MLTLPEHGNLPAAAGELRQARQAAVQWHAGAQVLSVRCPHHIAPERAVAWSSALLRHCPAKAVRVLASLPVQPLILSINLQSSSCTPECCRVCARSSWILSLPGLNLSEQPCALTSGLRACERGTGQWGVNTVPGLLWVAILSCGFRKSLAWRVLAVCCWPAGCSMQA